VRKSEHAREPAHRAPTASRVTVVYVGMAIRR
jgi:hypothetical protein